MSKRRGKGPKLELKLNLSPTRSSSQDVESNHSPNSSRGSSCASTDPAGGEISGSGSNMVLVGCPRCLMFVMLPEADPRCPQCKSAILLDFVSGDVLSPSAAKKGR